MVASIPPLTGVLWSLASYDPLQPFMLHEPMSVVLQGLLPTKDEALATAMVPKKPLHIHRLNSAFLIGCLTTKKLMLDYGATPHTDAKKYSVLSLKDGEGSVPIITLILLQFVAQR